MVKHIVHGRIVDMGRYIYSTRSPGEKQQPRGVGAMVGILRGCNDCDGGSVEIKNKKT